MSDSSSDPRIRWVREIVAATLAAMVTVFTLLAMWQAFRVVTDANSFARSKDLLLVLTPFFGVVLGYYFNRVSTEGRAEIAETNARDANAEARDANDLRVEADLRANDLRAKTDRLKGGLNELVQRGQEVTSRATSSGTDSDVSRLEPAGRASASPTYLEDFHRALDHASALLAEE